uniref:Methyltransferase phm5 n=1 Tax=Pyrenochaetopsis sp. TaxID=1756125 RepID=PHM5_PYRSX|nr:RecName: Full=Methyltransferase phm5; AltName: Full=Phomasetin biosynthesis cluster protein 5 [Pyrenochaetopsis sp.]BBC43188.1 methyltransferase [Pyrenochaetopsis sp.]
MAVKSSTVDVRAALQSAGAHYMNLIEFGILKVFIDHQIFDHIPAEGSISVTDLATRTKAEVSLLQRFSDYLVASEVLASPAPHELAHTTRSLSYRSEEIAAGFVSHVYHFFLRPMATWTAYFEENGLREPKDAKTIPLGLATGHPEEDLYGVLDKEPRLAYMFNVAQARSAAIFPMKGLYDFAWLREALEDHIGAESPAIVDIGGSHGLALKELLAENPFIPSKRCAVLDFPQTVEQAQQNLDEDLRDIHFIGGSMLEPLPVALHAAGIYQFRRVLSDFVDKDIILALEQVRRVCAPYSRVLIIEELVKASRDKFAIAQDISVLNFGGKRRSEADWHQLASQAGLQVRHVFEQTETAFAVVELGLA